jgi:predicted HicB family RNase H-like nuclease
MTLAERITQPSDKPQQAVITVRVDRALHQSLKDIAHEKRISLNGLCVASLEHAIESLAPAEDESKEQANVA